MTSDYEQAKLWIMQAKIDKKALSVGLVGDVSTILQKLLQDDLIPDIVTDQTGAQDPLNGYIPQGSTIETARQLRAINPTLYLEKSLSTMAVHVKAILDMKQRGAIVFEGYVFLCRF
jgi:urocanate hydratase